ncbi:amidohydrolase [Bacillus sp. FJAT-45037]|uniref:amidohydrolase n=1 Tax=Bacillus sp. FJAT-45037 TaxID=2011007 RepID=UPI000C23EE34|nr:amidohydrolase [Bacillus sp. FJAT-45037]
MSCLIHSVAIYTGEEKVEWLETGYVLIEDGVFTKVESGQPPQALQDEAGTVIDGRGKWLTPGMVNTHGHVGMMLLRGYSDDLPLDRWLKEEMWPFEAKLDAASVKAARDLGMVEMIRSGTTTFLEMYHLNMHHFAEDIIEVGLRATLARSMIGLCSKEEQLAKLEESVDFAKTWNNAGNGNITTMLAPHAPYTCPPNFIESTVDEAEKINVPVHMHVAETRKEVNDHIKQYGAHPVSHLEQMGVLDRVKWLFAHSVHVNDEQMELLRKYDVAISHNPISNLKLGSGVAPIPAMLKKGIRVGIGTDSVASNNTLDMFEEMRMAALIHKGMNEDPVVINTKTALKLATKNGAEMLGFKNLGLIKVGYQADCIMIDSDVAHLQPTTNPISHLVYAAKGSDVTDVFVGGRQLMRDRELLTIDEEKIISQSNEHFKRIHASI